MPEYIIRILRQVEVLQKVDERVIEAPSESFAKREAMYILAEQFPDSPDIVTEVSEKQPDTDKHGNKRPF